MAVRAHKCFSEGNISNQVGSGASVEYFFWKQSRRHVNFNLLNKYRINSGGVNKETPRCLQLILNSCFQIAEKVSRHLCHVVVLVLKSAIYALETVDIIVFLGYKVC